MATVPPPVPEITPEKLTIMKIKAGGFERDILSEPSSPIGMRHSHEFSNGANGLNSSLTRRSSRQVSSSSRRSSSFMHSHRVKMSQELTSQAEGKFFALMDLMSTASREASSLKESWARIISERESLLREKEELLTRVEETTDFLERKETEQQHHGHELIERKKQVDKLLLELSTALSTLSDQKQTVAERERELELIRTELRELQTTMSRTHGDHDKTKAELEAVYLKLKTCEEERDHSMHSSSKHHSDLRALLREHTDLKSKFTETSTKLDSARKEILSLNDRIKMWELERDEHLHEKDRLQEDVKRAKVRTEETSRELYELTERHDRVQRESTKLKETLRSVETERDDHALVIENLRREIKAKAAGWEEADERCAEVTLKYEHIKREVVSVKDKLRDIELERSELRDSIDRSREEHRLITISRDQLKEELEDERRKLGDGHRRIVVLEESLRRAEHSVTEVRSEMHTLTERIKNSTREGEETRFKNGQLTKEVATLREKLVILQAEIHSITEARDVAYKELHSWKHKYEEMTETITEFRDDSGELEYEIENLRTLLREAREQKERAISARHAADRERDEFIAKYEEKCRELERFEESVSSHYRSLNRGEGKSSFTRTVSTSGTTIHNTNGRHEQSSAEGNGMFSSP